MKFCWATLHVKNLEESIKFYEEVVGLEVSTRFPAGPEMEIAFMGNDETKVELLWNKNVKEVNMGSDISLGFTVDSVEDKINFLKEKNIDIKSGPFSPNPHTKFFFIEDPNKLTIQFVEQK